MHLAIRRLDRGMIQPDGDENSSAESRLRIPTKLVVMSRKDIWGVTATLICREAFKHRVIAS